MAGEIPDLIALERTGTGKGAARQARREGYVPGIVYGGGKDPLPINLPFDPLLTRLRKGRFLSTLFNMKVDGHDDVRVICRGVQRDVVKDLPTHVDFMRLRRTTKINLFIHVDIVDREKSPGLRKGGVLNMVRPEVELIVTAGDIPDHLTASVAGMDFGDTLTISKIELPEGAKPVIDRDFVICNVQAPSTITAGAEDGEDEARPAPGEVPTTSDDKDED